MTSIYLVRHGQTAWNKEEIFRGRTDIPLDETGLKQAELVGQYFKGMEIQAIYSSSLSRAWQTAQKVAQFHDLEVRPLQGIIDMSFGNWEGRPHQEIRENDSKTYRRWMEEPHLVKLPGGESLDDVRVRATAALEEVIRKNPGKTLVFVYSSGHLQSFDLCHPRSGQFAFLADHSRYNGHQPDPTQKWKIHSIADERDLPSQTLERAQAESRLLTPNVFSSSPPLMGERWVR